MRVLARAYRDRPLDRVLVGENVRVFYIAHRSSLDSTGKCESGGVGFPRGTVFEFDSALYDSLTEAWACGDRAKLAQLWAQATPLTESAMAA